MEALMNNLGMVCRKVGIFKRTKNKPNRTVNANSKCAKHIMQGNAFYNLGMFKKAIKSYNQALKSSPDDDRIHLNLGNAYKSLGKFKEAVKSYKKVVHATPDNALAHYNLGLAYGKLKMHKQAKNSLQQSLAIDPNNAQARYNLAVIHLTLQENNEALNEYRLLNNLSPALASKLSEMLGDQSI